MRYPATAQGAEGDFAHLLPNLSNKQHYIHMKKTIITALLAATLAVGASAADYTPVYSTTSFSGNTTIDTGVALSTDRALTMTVVVDWNEFSKETFGYGGTYTKFLEMVDSDNGGKFALALTKESNAALGNTSAAGLMENTTVKVAYDENNAYSNYAFEGVVTMTVVRESSGLTTLYALNEDETMSTLGSFTAAATTSTAEYQKFFTRWPATATVLEALYVYNTALDADGVQAVSLAAHNAHAIPEPATATLSLLALAGLAARRRRK